MERQALVVRLKKGKDGLSPTRFWPAETLVTFHRHEDRYFVQATTFDQEIRQYTYRYEFAYDESAAVQSAIYMAEELESAGIKVDDIRIGFVRAGYTYGLYPSDPRMYMKTWDTLSDAIKGTIEMLDSLETNAL